MRAAAGKKSGAAAPSFDRFARRCGAGNCAAWPGHGYDVFPLQGRPGTWWCAAHDPGPRAGDPGDANPALMRPPRQGALL